LPYLRRHDFALQYLFHKLPMPFGVPTLGAWDDVRALLGDGRRHAERNGKCVAIFRATADDRSSPFALNARWKPRQYARFGAGHGTSQAGQLDA
jgi:hypothetical protein